MSQIKDFAEELIKVMTNKGLTREQAANAINSTKFTPEELMEILQESKETNDVLIDINEIPSYIKETFEKMIKFQELSHKLHKIENDLEDNVKEFAEKTFPAINKASDKVNSLIKEYVESRSEVTMNMAKDGKDAEEIRLINELELHIYRKKLIRQYNDEFHINDKMLEDYQAGIQQLVENKTQSTKKSIDDLSNEINERIFSISKTLFINIEEAKLICVNENFFSMFFNLISEEDLLDRFKEVISQRRIDFNNAIKEKFLKIKEEN